MIEFVSYDGRYPALCCGTLVLSIEGVHVSFRNALRSGGTYWFDEDGDEHTKTGPWVFDPEFAEIDGPHFALSAEDVERITALVNKHVPYGCCGGCL